MSSPVAINRPSSPSAASVASSASSASSSASQALTYTREELLVLATSPLAHARAPAHLRPFPEIARRTRRGVVEAFQALEYARLTSPGPEAPPSHQSHVGALSDAAPLQRTDVYVPPARRTPSPAEQRMRPTREARARLWGHTGPARR